MIKLHMIYTVEF